MNRTGKINQRDYKFWVVVDNKIESGWEYQEDAKDQLENLPAGKRGKVLGKVGLSRLSLDPDNDNHWHKGYIASELLKVAKDLTGFEFPTKEALNKYLEEHPGAKKSLHRVNPDAKPLHKQRRMLMYRGPVRKFHYGTKELLKIAKDLIARYPSKYFSNPTVRSKAESYGLMDVENEDLTVMGLIAKLEEWQEAEHGVDAFIYDQAAKTLMKHGHRMPPGITRKA